MLDESKHGTPVPPGGPQSACSEFEAMLMDALDGTLTGAGRDGFDAHRRACTLCGPMFAEAEAGRMWLRSLESVEPPPHLVHNILVATTGVVSTRLATSAARARLRLASGCANGGIPGSRPLPRSSASLASSCRSA